MPHFMNVFISFKTLLDNKMFIFEEYDAFNTVCFYAERHAPADSFRGIGYIDKQ